MNKFKAGDRVRIYGFSTAGFLVNELIGTIRGTQSYDDDPWVSIETEEGKYVVVHEKQCSKLKPKSQRREWWINERSIKKCPTQIKVDGWSDSFENNDGHFINPTKPENTDGWICVREVLVKK